MECVIQGADREKLRHIIRSLNDSGVFPLRQSIIGSLQNVLRNLIGVTLEVDRWPDFKTIISRLHMPQLVEGDDKAMVNLQCYTTNPEHLSKLLKTTSVIPWEIPFFVSEDGATVTKHLTSFQLINNYQALPVSLEPIWLQEVQARGGTMVTEDGKTYNFYAVLEYDPIKNYFSLDRTLPEGFTMGRLRPEDAELVSKCWKFGGAKRVDERIRFGIKKLPNICIFNEKGEPVSWNNTQMDGSGAIGHTLPEYRRRGLYIINMAELRFRQSQAGMLSYGYILEDNDGASKALHHTPWSEKVIFGKYSPAGSKL